MDIKTLTAGLENEGLEVVIGLETHIRLNTRTKLFCSCPNQDTETPNQHICAVCTGQMGVLPALNKEAIRKAIYFGKAVRAQMKNTIISWDRKHYTYPDQPKNFQLTQFHRPIIPNGEVECFRQDGTTFNVQLAQVHIEEDAAKLMHENNRTLVDFNKSGVPLIEVVTQPCIKNITDAAVYAQYLQRIVQNLKISEANLEKGEFKSDVSVSLRRKNSPHLNPRTEIKNLNSFKFMTESLVEEVSKQLHYFKTHKKPRPDQTTVLWDADLKQTKVMRQKEFAADYRYLPEPDIPLVNIASAIETISVNHKSLPFSIEKTLVESGIRPQDAKFFTADAIRSEMFLSLNEQINDAAFVAKTLSNSLKPEDYTKIPAPVLVEIFTLFKAEKITSVLLQTAISALTDNKDFDYRTYFAENTISASEIEAHIRETIAENEGVAQEIRTGNKAKIGLLIGKTLKKVGKGVSGKQIKQILTDQLLAAEQPKTTPTTASKTQKPKQSTDQKEDHQEFFQKIGIVLKDKYRTHKITDISVKSLAKTAILAGWVASVRDHGELVFIDLRDSSYEILQVRLNRENFANLDELAKLKPESIIMVHGKIIARADDDHNPTIRTGTLELDAHTLEILNGSKTLPFELKRASKTNEQSRFKYKFLDHRSKSCRETLINRHKVVKLLRDILDTEGFIEVETPILTAGTDEGAREFIVPSRKFAGSFYTLPQAPQQFKQMLMVGGFEKYFQIARCFRDEDSRGDRQPEFTQLDLEMAFASRQDLIELNTKLFTRIVGQVYAKTWKLLPFRTLSYQEAMQDYGTDRPDLRFGLQMQDITQVVQKTEFRVFAQPIADGGIVKCIKITARQQKKGRISKGQIEKLTALAQAHGLGGLAYIIVHETHLQSPIIKFLGEKVAAQIIDTTKAKVGDLVFFAAADHKTANSALDAVRQALGSMLNLIDPKVLCPAWIIDFPFFEKKENGGWTFTHNPFSMPKVADLDKHLAGKDIGNILAQQYDLVLNGYEIGGGSVRAHKTEILEATYKNMGYNKAEMKKSIGHLYDAFGYGAPPHAGIAWGIDRLMMILERKSSIREVIAFPKTGAGEDLMFGSPSPLSAQKLREANVQSRSPKPESF